MATGKLRLKVCPKRHVRGPPQDVRRQVSLPSPFLSVAWKAFGPVPGASPRPMFTQRLCTQGPRDGEARTSGWRL